MLEDAVVRFPSKTAALLMILPIIVVGCGTHSIIDRDWPDATWRHGPYVLLNIDTEADMSLSMDLSDGGALSIVKATVFAVGANEHYVVAKQHPSADGVRFDSTVTNFFIVDRATESADIVDTRSQKLIGVRTPKVIGPLSRTEFEHFGRTHDLPTFTKTFATLEWQRTGE